MSMAPVCPPVWQGNDAALLAELGAWETRSTVAHPDRAHAAGSATGDVELRFITHDPALRAAEYAEPLAR